MKLIAAGAVPRSMIRLGLGLHVVGFIQLTALSLGFRIKRLFVRHLIIFRNVIAVVLFNKDSRIVIKIGIRIIGVAKQSLPSLGFAARILARIMLFAFAMRTLLLFVVISRRLRRAGS